MISDYKKEMEDLVVIVTREGASDLHLTVGRPPTIRVSGDLIPIVKKSPLTSADTLGLVSAILSEESQKEFLARRDIDFSYSLPSGVRFRGNAFYQKGMVGASFRLIPLKIKSLEELSLPAQLAEFARREQGFFLVVGPVGQGKSTTLASLVDLINHERSEHIVTVEDPIEYIFTNDRSIIDQREVRFDTTDFHSALRAMFRQDVNVGMVGEMRDSATMATAVTAAETGHLIFSTLHTNSASQTIDRIIDTFPSTQQRQIRVQLAGSLIGIFSQRLVPRVSGGLIPAYELLINTNAVANLIREGRTAEIDVLIETGAEEGMVDLNHSLAELTRRGEINAESAFRYSLDTRALERLMG